MAYKKDFREKEKRKFETSFNDLDDEVEDNIDITNTDIKLNPDYYMHLALIFSQQVLKNTDLKTTFIQYSVIINDLEVYFTASGKLKEEYKNAIEEFKKSEEYLQADETGKAMKLALKKKELILTDIFDSKTITGSVRA